MADMVFTGLLLLSYARLTVSQAGSKCGSPKVYANIYLEDVYVQQSQFNPGDKVKYKCALGYRTVPGGTRVSYCERGAWTPITLRCDRKKCTSAGELLNGQFNYEGNLYGDAVYAECNAGYVLKGDHIRHCDADGWSGSPPVCEAAAIPTVTCSSPSKKSATFHGTKATYAPGESLPYSCNVGFRHSAPSRALLCDDRGRWRPSSPTCERITCPNFQVEHGTARKRKNPTFNTTATITCSGGYRLRGPKVVTCSGNSSWVPAPPTCEPVGGSVLRGKVTCPPPSVRNSLRQVGNRMAYNVGQRAAIVCQDGFDLSGSSEVTCGPDGRWLGTPECREVMPPAEMCPRPPYLPDVYARYKVKDQYDDGENVEYTCPVGYRFTGGSRRIECRDGRWTKLHLNCQKKRCGSAGEMENGQFQYTGVSFGDTVTARCNEGYELVGLGIRTCTAEGWDGRSPVCEVVKCPDPPSVLGADWFLAADGPSTFGHTASYRCRHGRLIGSPEIHCTKDGTWTELPHCQDW